MLKVHRGVSGPRIVDAALLRGEHHLVDVALLAREAARDREGAGHVGGVAAVLGGGVDQHQVAGAQLVRVVVVVEDGAVPARGHDRVVPEQRAAGHAELALHLGLDLVLE